MSLDMEKVRAAKARVEQQLAASGGGSRASFWRPETKTSKIRVMPAWTEEGSFSGQFWREVGQHWNVSEDKKAPVLCPLMTERWEGEKNCPICEYVDELKADKSDVAAWERVKKIRAKKTFFLNIIDLTDPTYTVQDVADEKSKNPEGEIAFEVGDPKLRVYAAPPTVYDAIMGIITVNNFDITDLAKGNDITITKGLAANKKYTKYTATPMIIPTASIVGPDVELPDLTNVGWVVTADDMVQLLAEGQPSTQSELTSGDSEKALGDGESDTEESTDDDAEDLEAKMKAHLKG